MKNRAFPVNVFFKDKYFLAGEAQNDKGVAK